MYFPITGKKLPRDLFLRLAFNKFGPKMRLAS